MRIRLTVPVTVLLALACRPAPPPAPQRVANPTLGIAFAALPEGCAASANAGERLEIACDLEGSVGRLTVEVGPEQAVNLVEAVRAQPALFEALPEGRYLGNRELMTPIGSAYTARGRYREGEEEVEETRVLAVHPQGRRLLTLHFRYPGSDDAQGRIQQLIAMLGEVEGAGEAPAQP